MPKAGKTGRGAGRNTRQPAKQRYAAERRWVANSIRRVYKHAKKYGGLDKMNIPQTTRDEVTRLLKKRGETQGPQNRREKSGKKS